MLVVDTISVKAVRNGPVVLHDVSFRVPHRGGFLAVLGANGSGKSTLLRAIGGELPLRLGSIQWNGRDMRHHGLEELARTRAFLDQSSRVPFAFTAREVVRMGRYPFFQGAPSTQDERAVDEAMQLMHVSDLQHRIMPTLSGGEQQRVHIARVLAQTHAPVGPGLLLLDEPLNDLDIKHQHAILGIAQAKARAGATVIAVLHDVDLASRYADRILLMKEGRSLGCGTPAQVLDAEVLEVVYGMPATVEVDPLTDERRVRFGSGHPRCEQMPINALENWTA